MKITDVKVSVSTREVPPMAHRDRVGTEPWDIVLIRVLTDEGVEGNAFGWGVRSGEVTAKIVADVLKPALVAAGLPESRPAPGGSFPWAWTTAGALAVVLLMVLVLRRRSIVRFRTVRSTA